MRYLKIATGILAVILGLAAGGVLCGCSGPLTIGKTASGGDKVTFPALTYPRQLAPCPAPPDAE